ncbi:TonB-dependent receptor [Rhodoferax sp.]|uniref:TonB-dependent receptor n=1 Tax=Rhodoferax sp. TaxID=50421 RepID=UPI00275180C1|nr:TonB-dependent receptor [Rhodoferax sp.]
MNSSRHWAGFSRTALSVAVAILAAAPALAQNTTASVGGRVTGADGKPVAGASVTILHRESGSVNKVLADDQGRYSARGLRVGGPYTVTFSKGGVTQTRDDVYLLLAEATSLDAQIGGAVLAKVEITGSAGSKFNSGSAGAGTSIGRQELDAFASISRGLQDYARMDPRLSQTDKDRGEISAGGQNSRYNALTIDGVRTNDPFGLEANGLPTLKQPISIDAIQAVQINLSNYDVTQQGYTGANINAVTKSGTNDWKGSVYYVFRDDSMAGDRYNRATDTFTAPPPATESTKGFVLGGPIIKDKLFFFASYEELKSSRNAPTFGPMGSSLINVGITQAQIDAARTAAMSKYKVDIGAADVPSDVQTSVKDTLLKLDWNINDNHRANIRYAKTEQSDPIFPFNNSTGLSLSSHWYATNKTIETVVGQWFGDWTDKFSTELKVSTRDYQAAPANNASLPQISLVYTGTAPAGTATGDRTLRFGTEETRHFNNLQTKTSNAYLAGNLALDNHEIKFGGDIERNKIDNAFVRRAWGDYSFRGADPVALFLAGNPTSYTVQLPFPGRTLQDGAASMSMSNTGLFVQDTWALNKNLTLAGGIRLDKISISDRPLANAAASSAMVPGNPATNARQSGGFGYDNTNTLDGQQLVQPRFSFNYNFDAIEGRKSQVRGGAGLFQGSAANVWLINPFQNTGVAIASYTCATTGNNICPPGLTLRTDPLNQPVISGIPPAPQVDFIAPGVSQPSVWKVNLAFDKELPWFGLVLGAEWLHTEVKQGLYYKHLNLGAATATAPDGRQMFWNAGGRNANCWNGSAVPPTSTVAACSGANRPTTKALSNTAYSNVTLIDTSGKGGGDAVTLSLSGVANRDINWTAAYTRTTATEVSPLTSSTANSNFTNRAVYNPNEEVAANSAYLVRDRVNGSINWSRALWGSYKTTFGLFFEGRTGKPYSWTFRNDMNGDGITGNDLLYVPKAPGSGEVLFRGPASSTMTAAEAEAAFWAVVDGDKALSAARGGVVARNSAFSKFSNSFDLRLSQEVPGIFAGHKGVISLDILNVGNLLNKRWGHINEITFRDQQGGNTRQFVNFSGFDPATGKAVYALTDPTDFTTKQFKGESQWAAQVTLKYTF